jgi:tetratricopeptide (TPR) repeat protein
MRRKLNVKLFGCLLASVLVLGIAVHFIHAFQVRRNAGALLERADKAEKDGHLPEAAQYLRRYRVLVPDDTDALARYGFVLSKLARTPKGAEQVLWVFEQVLRADPGRDDARREVVRLFMNRLKEPRFADARHHLEILRRSRPADAEVEQLLALCCEAQGEYKEARHWWDQAIRHAPDRQENYERLAALLRRHNPLDEGESKQTVAAKVTACWAQAGLPSGLLWVILYPPGQTGGPHPGDKIMDALVAANGRSFQAFLARMRYRKQYALPGAEADLARAQRLGPREPEVVLAAAGLAREKGNPAQARILLNQGLETHPQDARLYLALADLEHQADRRGDAIACLRRGLKQKAGNAELLYALAELLIQGRHTDEARKCLAQLRRAEFPAAPLAYLDARLAMVEEKWGEAARGLEEVRSAPTATSELKKLVDLALGQCYQELGEVDQQYAAFQRAARREPGWAPATRGRAAALAAMGKIDEAVEEYRKIPDSPEGRLALARLLILRNLRLSPERRQWEEVDKLLPATAPGKTEAVAAIILRAEALAARSRQPEALDLLRRAQRQHPRAVDLWTALAGLAENSEKPAAALDILDEAGRVLGDGVELQLARLRYWLRRPAPEARKALAQLQQNVDRLPKKDRPTFQEALAEGYSRVGAPRAAQQLWARLAQDHPKDLKSRQALFYLALDTGDLSALERWCKEIQTIEGNQGTWWRYAHACRKVWQARQEKTPAIKRALLAEARTLLAPVAVRRPGWVRVPLSLAEMDELEDNPGGAIKHYLRAVMELGVRDPGVIQRVVQLLYDRRRYVEADAVIEKLQEQTPRLNGDLQRLVAEVSLRNEDRDRALLLARKAVSGQSTNYRDLLWLGQMLWSTGQLPEAEEVFRRSLELGRANPEPWVALVQYFARTGRKARAEALIEEARAKVLTQGKHPLDLAQCYEAVGDLERARELYHRALADRPDDSLILRSVARFELRSGRFKEATPHLFKLLNQKAKAAEDAAWARRILPLVLASAGDYQQSQQALAILGVDLKDDAPGKDEQGSLEDQRTKAWVLAAARLGRQRQRAIAILERLHERQPLPEEDRFLLAQLYDGSGAWPRAQALLRLLTSGKDNPLHLAFYAHALVRHGELDLAQGYVDRLQKIPGEKRSFRTVEIQVRLLAGQGQGDRAIAELLQFAADQKAQPAAAPDRLLLAAALLDDLDQARPKEKSYAAAAEKTYRQLAERQPERVLALVSFLSRHGRLAEALDLCERAWEHAAPEAVGNAAMAALHGVAGSADQFRRVERWLKAALTQHPRNVGLRVCLADLRDLQGNYAEAVALYQEVLQYNPRVVEALNNLAWLLALRENKGSEALALIARAIDLMGPVPELLDTRAVILLTLGKNKEAIQELEAALAEKAIPASYFHLAQAYARLNQQGKAAQALARARDLAESQLHALERPAYRKLRADLAKN